MNKLLFLLIVATMVVSITGAVHGEICVTLFFGALCLGLVVIGLVQRMEQNHE